MMKAIQEKFLVCIVVVFLVACSRSKIPEGILPLETMQKLTTDLLLLDGYITTISRPDSAVMLRKVYKNALYKKYRIDSVIYLKNFIYYNSDSELIEDMYQNIQKDLDTLKKSALQLNAPKFKKDSLNLEEVK